MNKTYYEQIGTSEQLKTDMENVYNIYFKDKTVDRNHLTEQFSKSKYILGINPYTSLNVIVNSYNLSYILKEHGNQMPKEDFLSLTKILNYTFLYKNSGKTNLENEGFRYYKKASDGKHWLEAATKYDEEETLIHFLRMRKSSFISKAKKIADLFIDERKNP